MCVDDVKSEISKKRSENKVMYCKSHPITPPQDGNKRGHGGDFDLTQQEREKIIEVLLSQERVLTLLYDKTFPPRSMNKQGGGGGATAYGGFGGGGGGGGNNKFNFGDDFGEEYEEGGGGNEPPPDDNN